MTGERRGVLETKVDLFGFALSPDGTRYATGDNNAGGLFLADIDGGDRRRVTGIPADGTVRQVFWQTDTRFFVTTTDRVGIVLWSCTVNADCDRLTDLTRDPNESAAIPFG
jgi:hypothetical protein